MNVFQSILLVLLVILLVALGGVVVIWALNTLFPALTIAYNFYTVLAAVILTSTVSGVVSRE